MAGPRARCSCPAPSPSPRVPPRPRSSDERPSGSRRLWAVEPPARPARHRAMRTPNGLPGVVLLALVLARRVQRVGPGSHPNRHAIDPAGRHARSRLWPSVQARTPLFDDFGPKRKDIVGQDHWWEALPLDGSTPPSGWTVRFTAGWGDCPAGCIDQHSWTWTVTSDGAVTFVSERGLGPDPRGPGRAPCQREGHRCRRPRDRRSDLPGRAPGRPGLCAADGGGSRAARP